jgi:hypothetical protein
MIRWRAIVFVLTFLLAGGFGWADVDDPYDFEPILAPGGADMEQFYGVWGAVDGQLHGYEGDMTIGPGSKIIFEDIFPNEYRIVRRYPDRIVLVALGKDGQDRWMNLFLLLARRYDPVRKIEFLFLSYRHDDRLIADDPLTRPIAEYEHILDTPDEKYFGKSQINAPWGPWSHHPYVRAELR